MTAIFAAELIWTTIGIVALIVSSRLLYHALLDRCALVSAQTNGLRLLIVVRDIIRGTLQIVGALAMIISGCISLYLSPSTPDTDLTMFLRFLFPWCLVVVGVVILLLPINDDVARRKFFYQISLKEEATE